MFCIRQAITIPQSSKEDEERRMQIKEAIARVIAVDKKTISNGFLLRAKKFN